MQNFMLTESYHMEPYNFCMTVICNETATQSLSLNFCMLSIFPALEIKELYCDVSA